MISTIARSYVEHTGREAGCFYAVDCHGEHDDRRETDEPLR